MLVVQKSRVPHFRLTATKELILKATTEADDIAAKNKTLSTLGQTQVSSSPADVTKAAQERAMALFGSSDELTVDGQRVIKFGQYKGQVFKWVLENAMGWAIQLISSIKSDKSAQQLNTSILGANKSAFFKYVMQFPQIAAAVDFSDRVHAAAVKAEQLNDEGEFLLEFGEYKNFTMKSLYESTSAEHRTYVRKFIIPKKNVIPGSKMDSFRKYCLKRSTTETEVPFSSQRDLNLSASHSCISDEELMQYAASCEVLQSSSPNTNPLVSVEVS